MSLKDRTRGSPAPRDRVAPSAITASGASQWRRGVTHCVALWLGVGLAVSLLGLVGPALLPSNDGAGVPGWPPPRPDATVDALGSSLERWDGLWYLRIATDGYRASDGSAAFFPLYPLVVRGLSPALGGHPLAAALLLSHGAFLAALLLLYRAVTEDFDADTAARTVVCLALFPASFFFYAPYPESLFLLTSVASLWSARRGRWAAAGTAAALASATRPAGLVLLLPLAAEALRAARAQAPGRARLRGLVRPLGAVLVAPLGAAFYLLYWHLEFGDWLAPVTQQSRWLREPSWPWETVAGATTAAWRSLGAFPGGYHMIDWLIVCPMLAIAAWGTPRLPVAQRLYVWGALLPPLCFAFSGRPLMSLPRGLLVLWPLFIGVALLVARPAPRAVLIGVSSGGLALLTVLYVNWYWIF